MEELENFFLRNYSKGSGKYRYVQRLFQNEDPSHKGGGTLYYLIVNSGGWRGRKEDLGLIISNILSSKFNEDDILAFLFQYFEVVENNATPNP